MDFIRTSHVEDIVLRADAQRETSLKKGWRFAAIMMLLSAVMMAYGYFTILQANLNVDVSFVRIDGVQVNENFDVRRDVLIDNIRARQKLMREGGTSSE